MAIRIPDNARVRPMNPGVSSVVHAVERPIGTMLVPLASSSEVERFHDDFDFSFDSGDVAASEMRVVHDLLRAARALRFSAPLPLADANTAAGAGTGNLYLWIARSAPAWHFKRGMAASHAGPGAIYIKRELLSISQNQMWTTGMMHLLGLIVHEAAHAGPGGLAHNCDGGKLDSSIEYGGAWAAQYWYYVGLATRTGETQLTPGERAEAAGMAEDIRAERFCDNRYGKSLRGLNPIAFGRIGQAVGAFI